jgi:hypothetical protein
MRKTIDIRTLLDMVNERLATSTDAPAGRYALCSLIETVLHDAGVYHGYAHLTAEHVPAGQMPGVMKYPEFEAAYEGKIDSLQYRAIYDRGSDDRVFPDDSRRNYCVHRELRAKRRTLFIAETV